MHCLNDLMNLTYTTEWLSPCEPYRKLRKSLLKKLNDAGEVAFQMKNYQVEFDTDRLAYEVLRAHPDGDDASAIISQWTHFTDAMKQLGDKTKMMEYSSQLMKNLSLFKPRNQAQLIQSYAEAYPDRAKAQCEAVLEIFKKYPSEDFDGGSVQARNMLADMASKKGDYVECHRYIDASLEWCKSHKGTPTDWNGLADWSKGNTLTVQGNAYLLEHRNQLAAKSFLNAWPLLVNADQILYDHNRADRVLRYFEIENPAIFSRLLAEYRKRGLNYTLTNQIR
jgi:hypothetical protein